MAGEEEADVEEEDVDELEDGPVPEATRVDTQYPAVVWPSQSQAVSARVKQWPSLAGVLREPSQSDVAGLHSSAAAKTAPLQWRQVQRGTDASTRHMHG